MGDIIVEADKFIVSKITDELLMKSSLEDKYIFWEEFNEGGCIVWFNTTDYTNKQLVDAWNTVKAVALQATDKIFEKITS